MSPTNGPRRKPKPPPLAGLGIASPILSPRSAEITLDSSLDARHTRRDSYTSAFRPPSPAIASIRRLSSVSREQQASNPKSNLSRLSIEDDSSGPATKRQRSALLQVPDSPHLSKSAESPTSTRFNANSRWAALRSIMPFASSAVPFSPRRLLSPTFEEKTCSLPPDSPRPAVDYYVLVAQIRWLLGPFQRLLLPPPTSPTIIVTPLSNLAWKLARFTIQSIFFASLYFLTCQLLGRPMLFAYQRAPHINLSTWSAEAYANYTSMLHRRPSELGDENPLDQLNERMKYGKLHSELMPGWYTDNVIQFAISAASPSSIGITACQYTNEFWLDTLPAFAEKWSGPLSVVYEATEPRSADSEKAVMESIHALHEHDPYIFLSVDFHIVFPTHPATSERLQQLKESPKAKNWHINLSRLLARTETLWIVADARVVPTASLYTSLQDESISELLEYQDGIVIPVFAKFGGSSSRSQDTADWPNSLPDLLHLSYPSGSDNVFTLHDPSYPPSEGPTSLDILASPIHRARATPTSPYPIPEYDLHYSPSLVISTSRTRGLNHPWCSERFEYNTAACTYQIYLSGAQLWVLPTAWAWTLEGVPRNIIHKPPSLTERISSKMYTAFHQEYCMHQGRMFLQQKLWNSPIASNLKYSCADVLATYGMKIKKELQS